MSLWHKLALSCGVLAASFSCIQANQITLYGYCGTTPLSPEMDEQAKAWGQEFAQKGDVVCTGDTSQGTTHSFTQGYGRPTNPFQANPEADKITSYIDLRRFLFNSGDAFVIAPCGIDGLSYALEILLWKRHKEHTKSVYFLGREYWQPVLTELKKVDSTLDYNLINSAQEIAPINPHTIAVTEKHIEMFFDSSAHLYNLYKNSKEEGFCRTLSATVPYVAMGQLTGILNDLTGHIAGFYTTKFPILGDEKKTEPLQNILQYFHDKGFLSQSYKNTISFYHSKEEFDVAWSNRNS